MSRRERSQLTAGPVEQWKHGALSQARALEGQLGGSAPRAWPAHASYRTKSLAALAPRRYALRSPSRYTQSREVLVRRRFAIQASRSAGSYRTALSVDLMKRGPLPAQRILSSVDLESPRRRAACRTLRSPFVAVADAPCSFAGDARADRFCAKGG